MVKKALLVATNGLCLQPVFGIPAIRRLVLLARQLGYGEIHVFSNGEPVFPALGDLVPSGAFHAHADASPSAPWQPASALSRMIWSS